MKAPGSRGGDHSLLVFVSLCLYICVLQGRLPSHVNVIIVFLYLCLCVFVFVNLCIARKAPKSRGGDHSNLRYLLWTENTTAIVIPLQ